MGVHSGCEEEIRLHAILSDPTDYNTRQDPRNDT